MTISFIRNIVRVPIFLSWMGNFMNELIITWNSINEQAWKKCKINVYSVNSLSLNEHG